MKLPGIYRPRRHFGSDLSVTANNRTRLKNKSRVSGRKIGKMHRLRRYSGPGSNRLACLSHLRVAGIILGICLDPDVVQRKVCRGN
jgi:hypothetical protein